MGCGGSKKHTGSNWQAPFDDATILQAPLDDATVLQADPAIVAQAPLKPMVKISVHMLSGEVLGVVEVAESSTVKDLKQAIQECKGLAPRRQQLVFDTIILEDNAKTLEHYGIKDNSVVMLCVLSFAVSIEVLGEQLENFGVNPQRFVSGVARSLHQLLEELRCGSAALMIQNQKLVRVVNVAVLRICAPDSKASNMIVLVETAQLLPDGRRKQYPRLPGMKRDRSHSDMNLQEVGEKIANELLPLDGATVKFDLDCKETFEEEEESPYYPGIAVIYRKQIIAGTLLGDAKKYVGQTEKPNTFSWCKEHNNFTRYFAWMKENALISNRVKYKVPDATLPVREPLFEQSELIR